MLNLYSLLLFIAIIIIVRQLDMARSENLVLMEKINKLSLPPVV